MTEVSKLAQISIPTQEKEISLDIDRDRPIFILGRNGTGKSALINTFARKLLNSSVYLPGSRPSYFEAEDLSFTANTQRHYKVNQSYYNSPDSRWKPVGGTTRNEKAIFDLQAAETQYKVDAANQIKKEGKNSSAINKLQTNLSPLDIVNSVLHQSNLSVQMEISDGTLKAKQAGAIYSHARMSDGERSALVFSAEVAAAKAGTIFLIDEPELHLHPSIVIGLIKALILVRPDCSFVVCTHELALPLAIPNGKIILVRGCSWQKEKITSWDIDIITDSCQIPEWLWIDVIGSRRNILFIEGNAKSSLDQPLYSLLFPSVTVRPLESCKDVIKAVEGLRAVEKNHRIKAFGIIDNDGMSSDQKCKFENNGVYPLPFFSVESIIYSLEVQSAVAKLQGDLFGVDAEKLLMTAKTDAICSLNNDETKEHLASRLAERRARDEILSRIPTRGELMNIGAKELPISFKSSYPDELEKIKNLAQNENIKEILERYPVRESGILDKIAKGLKFKDRQCYEQVALQCIKKDAILREEIRNKLGTLAEQLNDIDSNINNHHATS